MEKFLYFIFKIFIVWFLIKIGLSFYKLIKNELIKKNTLEKMEGMANGSLELTPKEFFYFKKGLYGVKLDFSGVYIIYNKDKKLYYIGKSKDVFKRISKHLYGNGNGDVYADYKYGDSFVIRTISEGYNMYSSLDELVIATKKEYDLFSDSY